MEIKFVVSSMSYLSPMFSCGTEVSPGAEMRITQLHVKKTHGVFFTSNEYFNFIF